MYLLSFQYRHFEKVASTHRAVNLTIFLQFYDNWAIFNLQCHKSVTLAIYSASITKKSRSDHP